jgi:Zn-dependent peptidase ImmA (M78 family)
MLDDLESAGEIDRRVDQLLRAADAYGRYPTPVDDIVAAAKLIQVDDYVLNDSKIAKAPAYLRSLLRSAKQKVQGLVDRRERVVHISPDIEHEAKRSFVKLHETTHDILPHQQDLVYADTNETLSLATKRLFEREANQGAAELLFQRKHFKRDANDYEIGLAAIWLLAERYGSSFHAALRRYAECHDAAVAAIVFNPTPVALTPKTWKREEAMATRAWQDRFGPMKWPSRLDTLSHPFVAALDFPLGEIPMVDQAGDKVTVRVEAQSNTYKRFALLWIPPQRRLLKPLKVRAVQG